MSGWEINLHSRKQNFHRFGTDDFALLEIGIGNYNLSSLANFFNLDDTTLAPISNKPINPDVQEFFSNAGPNTIINQLIGLNNLSTMAIMEFDTITKTYKQTVGFANIKLLDPQIYKLDKYTQPVEADINLFLKKWNDIQRGVEQNPKIINGYKAVAYRIQNSASGCLTFRPSLNILGTTRTPLIRLYLLDSSDSESSRTISFNGSPLITDFPKTVTGLTHSFGNSADAGPGTKITANTGDNNPKDKVAAQMDMVYDSSTGRWQSGTQQILARLLTDVDAANVPDLTPEQLEAMNREDNYESGDAGELWLGAHTTGKAIPLSAENGNPFMFGPDYKDGCTGDKKVKTTVVNRLNESYKAGSTVVLSKMAGENGNWVITSPGTPVSSKKKLGFGNFEYQQYIISAKYYFAIPGNTQRFLPNTWISKLRDDYYVNLLEDRIINPSKHVSNELQQLRLLNVIANGFDETVADPIERLSEEFNNGTPINSAVMITAQANSQIDNLGAFEFLKNMITKITSQAILPYNREYEKEISYPKNILKRTIVPGRLQNSRWYPPDPVGSLSVPIFWGMLFSEGYKSNQTAKYKDLVKDNPLLNNDPNFAELSVASTVCVPDLGSTLESLLFMRKFMNSNYNILQNIISPDVIRKTGGNFVYRGVTFLSNFDDLYNSVSLNNINVSPIFEAAAPTATSLFIDNQISKLEPVNPAKIQFSSLSLEALYMLSDLNAPDFAEIKKLVDFYKNVAYDSYLLSLKEYARKIIFNLNQVETPGMFANETGNKYNIFPLAYSNAFDPLSETLTRHPAPISTIQNDKFIIPSLNGSPRLPVMPVLTCKSKIRTSADSLVFTINENIGLMQKKTVSPGSASPITLLPTLPPLVLPGAGDVAPSVRATPQWGGGDDIDSFGTTALHVQIYEGFPINQVMYFGQIFTPLHFNPSSPDKISRLNYSDDGKINIEDTQEFSISSVDFRVPTYKIEDTTVAFGAEVPVGTSFNFPEPKNEAGKGLWNLAPQSEWRINTIRRAKLLSGGGFAYLKPVFAINGVNSIPKNGGTGYVAGETFTYIDGGKLTINGVGEGGAITSVSFVGNINGVLLKEQNSGVIGYTTPSNVAPKYNGQNGSGASFEITQFKLVNSIGYDRPPKSTQITRLTSPNNRGESDARIGTVQTTIDLPETDKNEYDIFYFYHNDPSHYSLDEFLPFNQGFAQHVISEIAPG